MHYGGMTSTPTTIRAPLCIYYLFCPAQGAGLASHNRKSLSLSPFRQQTARRRKLQLLKLAQTGQLFVNILIYTHLQPTFAVKLKEGFNISLSLTTGRGRLCQIPVAVRHLSLRWPHPCQQCTTTQDFIHALHFPSRNPWSHTKYIQENQMSSS